MLAIHSKKLLNEKNIKTLLHSIYHNPRSISKSTFTHFQNDAQFKSIIK